MGNRLEQGNVSLKNYWLTLCLYPSAFKLMKLLLVLKVKINLPMLQNSWIHCLGSWILFSLLVIFGFFVLAILSLGGCGVTEYPMGFCYQYLITGGHLSVSVSLQVNGLINSPVSLLPLHWELSSSYWSWIFITSWIMLCQFFSSPKMRWSHSMFPINTLINNNKKGSTVQTVKYIGIFLFCYLTVCHMDDHYDIQIITFLADAAIWIVRSWCNWSIVFSLSMFLLASSYACYRWVSFPLLCL